MKINPTSTTIRLGAHTSAAGGAWNALVQGKEIGANVIQFFTANQRQWHHRPLDPNGIERFIDTRAALGFREVMSHASYLLNLGSPDPSGLEKSRKAFREEIKRCLALKVDYLNFHPGAALQGSKEACLDRIVASMLEVQDLLPDGQLRLIIEMTAGQGSLVGARFEEIAYLVEQTSNKIPVGVCIDTCHIFAAGYDIKTAQGWKKTLQDFDRIVGLAHLYALHLNDSLRPFNSHKDRHAPIGEGEIGLDSFAFLMTSPLLSHLFMCLETPGGPALWKKEIALLHRLAKN